MARAAVFPHIGQPFLNNAGHCVANPRPDVYYAGFADKARCNAGFALESVDKLRKVSAQILGIYVQRFHLLHQFAELVCFLQQEVLDSAQFLRNGYHL